MRLPSLPRFMASLAVLAGLGLAGTSPLAATAEVRTAEVRAQLIAHAPDGVQPGSTLWLGLRIEHAPKWHTYWKNPGDSGLPTTLRWTLPAGFTAGEIQWPTPARQPIGPLMNYGYEGTLLLPVPVQVPADFKAPALDVQLRADWLVCKEVCIPEGGEFALEGGNRACDELSDTWRRDVGLLLLCLEREDDLASSAQPIAEFALPKGRWAVNSKPVTEEAGEEAKELGVDGIGFCELAGGACEVAGLSWIDSGDGESGIATGVEEGVLVATGRFNNDER